MVGTSSHTSVPQAERGSKRVDIQVLRGCAVLAVVGFHALPELLPRGYLGVDVFFVISGYLITGHILRGLEEGDFSFQRFYARRALRLLPASFSTLALTSVIASLLLTRTEWHDYLAQLLGVLTFTSNFVLAEQTGYFSGASHLKPLLHGWSLSLEEQFYLIAPVLLWALPGRFRGSLMGLAAVISFALCVWLASGWPIPGLGLLFEVRSKIAFFMLPTRAWQLLIGSLCAWLMLRKPRFPLSGRVKVGALVLLASVIAFGFDGVHPRGNALIASVATALILIGADGWLPDFLIIRAVKKVGDWSYSVYLLHWPLISFAHIAYAGAPAATLLFVLAASSIPLGYLQYTLVERPNWPQRGVGSGRDWAALGVLGAVATLVPAVRGYEHLTMEQTRLALMLAPNAGLGMACDQSTPSWQDLPVCRTSKLPKVALWGDSYAMHLATGLSVSRAGMVQLTRSNCPPVLGITPVMSGQAPEWAAACQRFNSDAFAHIVSQPSIRYVIISSQFANALNIDRQKTLPVGGTASRSGIGERRLKATLEALRRAGKIPVLVLPLPRPPFDPAICNLRRLEGRLLLGQNGCDFSLADMPPEAEHMRAALTRVSAATVTALVDPAAVLCSKGRCKTAIGSRLVYRDRGHLTFWGSRYVMEGTALRSTVTDFPSNPEHVDIRPEE